MKNILAIVSDIDAVTVSAKSTTLTFCQTQQAPSCLQGGQPALDLCNTPWNKCLVFPFVLMVQLLGTLSPLALKNEENNFRGQQKQTLFLSLGL